MVNKDNSMSSISPRGGLSSVSKLIPIMIAGLFVIGLAIFLLGFAGNKSGFSNVEESKSQAVYLKGGQIFFGDITSIDRQHLTLEGIYYLQVGETQQAATEEEASSEQGSAISLTKRGCEIFAPEDKMFISRDEVAYFENIRDDGDVAKGIKTWQNDNPGGLDCGDQS